MLNLSVTEKEAKITQLKEELKKEQHFRQELEDKYNEDDKRAESDIQQLSSQVDEGQQTIGSLTIQFNKFEKRSNELVSELIQQVDTLKREFERLAKANKMLLGKYLKKSQELFSEDISMPQSLDELQFYCLQLREDLITAISSREAIENKLKSENLFIKEQLRGEQMAKETMEENYSHDNHTLKSKYETNLKELSDLRKKYNKADKELETLRLKFNEVSLVSSNQVSLLETEVKELREFKVRLCCFCCTKLTKFHSKHRLKRKWN